MGTGEIKGFEKMRYVMEFFKAIANNAKNKKWLFVIVFFSLSFLSVSIYAQPPVCMILKSEAVMYEKDTAVSKKMLVVDAGNTVKAFEKMNGYFRVDYDGTIGYINEMFLQQCVFNNDLSVTTVDEYSDNDEIIYISPSPKPTFEELLRGIKTAVLLSDNSNTRSGRVKYLRAMGFENVLVRSSDELESLSSYNNQKNVIFVLQLQSKDDAFQFVFMHPQTGYIWNFSSKFNEKDALKYNYNFENISYEILRRAYPYKKIAYDQSYELHLAKRKTGWTEKKNINCFEQNGLKAIEGIYENSSGENQARYNVAVKYMRESLKLIYLSGADNPSDWDEGEVKATLLPTATSNFYKANWIMANKTENKDFYVSFEQGIMNVISPNGDKNLYIKMYPTANDNVVSSNLLSSGTGFAIASNGLIATNYHVIENAKTIKVRGVNGNFDKAYSAEIMLADRKNDLAIVKIKESSFASLGTIPYVFKTEAANVGADIFVLGYPLRASMGDEIKLTNGIVSAKTGFQGDVTSYQISAPVQPGNSGGALFNKDGDIVGIVNAKHTLAENASYAIKTSYLINLVNLLNAPPVLQKTSILRSQSLSQQTEIIKKFIYIIEAN
ncbi:serine protease [Bacteroides sp. OttesenSCG-928-J23]|nr:serine protease [Bacteroides sp. OttesenSCG-928-J23]MDL2303920.1 serine protease [Bacteroides sp. OttesenSCG-928-D19]